MTTNDNVWRDYADDIDHNPGGWHALFMSLAEEAAEDSFALTCELRSMGHRRAGSRRRSKAACVKIKLRRDGRTRSRD